MTCSMIHVVLTPRIHNYLSVDSEDTLNAQVESVEMEERSIQRLEALKNRLIQISLAIASASVVLIYSIAIPKLFAPLAVVGIVSSLFVLLNPVWNRLLADKKSDHLNNQCQLVRDYAIEAFENVAISYKAKLKDNLSLDEVISMTNHALELIRDIASLTGGVIKKEFSIDDSSVLDNEIARVQKFEGTMGLSGTIANQLLNQKSILNAKAPDFTLIGQNLPADKADTLARINILTIGAKLNASLHDIAAAYTTRVMPK